MGRRGCRARRRLAAASRTDDRPHRRRRGLRAPFAQWRRAGLRSPGLAAAARGAGCRAARRRGRHPWRQRSLRRTDRCRELRSDPRGLGLARAPRPGLCAGDPRALAGATSGASAAGDAVAARRVALRGPRSAARVAPATTTIARWCSLSRRKVAGVLFTGDVERRGELELVSRDPGGLRCDLLKVAHHGSATSSSAPFLAAARPRLALLSSGRRGTASGIPRRQSSRAFSSAGSRALRTDLCGGIVLRWRRGSPLDIELPGSPRAVLGRAQRVDSLAPCPASSPSSVPPPRARARWRWRSRRRPDGEIVNADALQVYRGFDIGTAKPSRGRTPSECRTTSSTSSTPASAIRPASSRAGRARRSRRSPPAAARRSWSAGSGLYLRALWSGIAPLPPVDGAARAALLERLEREGLAALHAELARLDPPTAAAARPGRHAAHPARPGGRGLDRRDAHLVDRAAAVRNGAGGDAQDRIDASARPSVRCHRGPGADDDRCGLARGGTRAPGRAESIARRPRFRRSGTGSGSSSWTVRAVSMSRCRQWSPRRDVSRSVRRPGFGERRESTGGTPAGPGSVCCP